MIKEKVDMKPKTFENRVEFVEGQLDSLKKKARFSRSLAENSTSRQVQAMEDQFNVLKKEFELKKVKSKEAFETLSEGTKKAWHDLTGTIDKAYDRLH